MHRRTILQSLAGGFITQLLAAQDRPLRRLLVRSSWQTVNIGDIAHTPGLLALLEKHLPEVEVRLWPSDVKNGVEEMLRRRFPRLQLVQGAVAIQQAFTECDFLLHASGPSLVAANDVKRWHEETHKPFGVFGITLPTYPPEVKNAVTPTVSDDTIKILSEARFVYFRDSVSLQHARERGCRSPCMEFGPDAAFAVDLQNDEPAEQFLQQHRLEAGRFLCCIPRLRHTPYWLIKQRPFDEQKHVRNEEMKEHDHAPLRAAIEEIIRTTDLKVLLCPEDQSQMAVGKAMLWDKLPATVQSRVVWREKYWLTDEALSTYRRSAGLFGLEMHSPIMCIGNGIPAIVCRFAEQTNKGFMWRDIGLHDWLFDMDRPEEVKRIVPTVLSLVNDPTAAKEKAARARQLVQQMQSDMVGRVRKELG